MSIWVDHPSISIPLYKSFWKIIDFIFPPSCVGCGTIGERMCSDCFNQIKKIELVEKQDFHFLEKEIDIGNRHEYKFENLSSIFSYAYYSPPISSAIKKLKYGRDIGITELLANFLVELYNKNKMDIDMVIPVPLSQKRINERGFNQSSLLALPFSLIIQKPNKKQALRRSRETQSQVGLNRQERLSNVSGAFTADPKIVKGMKILLIDDVTTTGATMEACASALKSAGAKDIVGLTVARAIPTLYGFSDNQFDVETA